MKQKWRKSEATVKQKWSNAIYIYIYIMFYIYIVAIFIMPMVYTYIYNIYIYINYIPPSHPNRKLTARPVFKIDLLTEQIYSDVRGVIRWAVIVTFRCGPAFIGPETPFTTILRNTSFGHGRFCWNERTWPHSMCIFVGRLVLILCFATFFIELRGERF